MLVVAAETLVADGKKMCLPGGQYEFAGAFCQGLIQESLILRGEANRFAGSGAWSAAAERWLNASNTALLAGAAGCGVLALATAGTGGVACAAIYAGATATSAATTAINAKRVLSRKGTLLRRRLLSRPLPAPRVWRDSRERRVRRVQRSSEQ